MLTPIRILDWQFEFDQAATAEAYTRLSMDCTCSFCRNFLIAVHHLPIEYDHFWWQFGIDPLKPAEIIEYNRNHDGTHFYSWWYHVVGRMIKGDNSGARPLESGITVEISSKNYLVAPDFPRPVLQLEFFANLPWLLAETCC